jgi:hypothetical protein
MTQRICGLCKQTKTLETDFFKGKGYRGGYQPRCKTCYKNYPSQAPDKTLARSYQVRKRNLQFVWDYYKAHPCLDCGETDPIVLEADHQRDKLDTIAKLAHHTRSLQVIQTELDKCEIVCRNCHTRRTAKTFGWYADIVR